MQAEDVTDRTDGWSLGERLGVAPRALPGRTNARSRRRIEIPMFEMSEFCFAQDNKAQESAKDEEHSFSNRRDSEKIVPKYASWDYL